MMLAAVQASLSFSAPASRLTSRVAVPTTRAADPSMCGILATVNSKLSPEALRLQTLTLQRLIRHRGPDGSGINLIENADGTCSAIAHERLVIVDEVSGEVYAARDPIGVNSLYWGTGLDGATR